MEFDIEGEGPPTEEEARDYPEDYSRFSAAIWGEHMRHLGLQNDENEFLFDYLENQGLGSASELSHTTGYNTSKTQLFFDPGPGLTDNELALTKHLAGLSYTVLQSLVWDWAQSPLSPSVDIDESSFREQMSDEIKRAIDKYKRYRSPVDRDVATYDREDFDYSSDASEEMDYVESSTESEDNFSYADYYSGNERDNSVRTRRPLKMVVTALGYSSV